MKYPKKVKRRPDRIPDVRYPGGMSDDFHSDGMSDVTCRTGGRLRVQGRESHVALFKEGLTVVKFKNYLNHKVILSF